MIFGSIVGWIALGQVDVGPSGNVRSDLGLSGNARSDLGLSGDARSTLGRSGDGQADLGVSGDGGSGLLLLLILAASCLAYLLGEMDDRGKIGPLPKALLQAALVIAPWFGFVALRGEGVPFAATLGLLLALALQIALGIFDNMDGALGSASLVGLLFLGASPAIGGAWVAAGATAGFLLWNRPPARLFLGNRGSSALATATAACFACHASTLPTSGVFLSALPFAWPLADLAFVTVRRLRAGRRPWEGGKDHTTHATARLLGTDRYVWLLVGASAALGALLARILRSTLQAAG